MERRQNLLEQKEETIEHLKNAFSTGDLALSDFESRVSTAENSQDPAELDGLVSDLPRREIARPVSEQESVTCTMATKKLTGSVLQTKTLNLEASMSTLTINYLETEPIDGVQEIAVNLTMSTLVLFLPDDVVVENRVQENMSSFKESRNKYYDPAHSKTTIKITGSAQMSSIHVKRKKYWFFSKKK